LDISNDENGQSEGVVDGNQWGEDRAIVELTNIVRILQNEGESTQNDLVQSTTQYYVHEPRHEYVTIGVQRLSEIDMEAKVVCLINPTQEVVIKNQKLKPTLPKN